MRTSTSCQCTVRCADFHQHSKTACRPPQVDESECTVYGVSRVRRPVAEAKAIGKTIELLRVKYMTFIRARSVCKMYARPADAVSRRSTCLLVKNISSCHVSLQEAKHPLLVLGAGANRKMTSKMLRQFVDTTKIPYCTTQMGKGVIDSREA